MRYATRTVVALLVAALMAGASALADMLAITTNTSFNLVYNSASYDPYEPCDGPTPGGTWLTPLSYLSPRNSYTNDLISALYGQYTVNTADPNFTLIYQYSAASQSLSGTMLIDWYHAVDDHIGSRCYHGADLVAYYDYGQGEGNLGLDWIQLYDESGGSVISPYEYTVDGAHDQSPAYYAPGYGPWTPPGYTLTSGHNMTWTDGPYDSHIETTAWAGEVEFYMFLASFGSLRPDPNSNSVFYQDVTIYDGVVWGYTGECIVVPEPATLALVCIGLVGLCCRRSRSRH